MAEPFFNVRIDGTKEMWERTRRIEENYAPSVEAAMTEMAKKYRDAIKTAIASGRVPGPGLSQFTKMKRRFGKLTGPGGPAIPAYGGSKPWLRSGTLLKSIRYKRMSKKRWSVFPEKHQSAYAGGKMINTAVLAGLLEYGFTVSIPETVRMRRYMYKLFQKSASSGSSGGRKAGGTGGRRTGRTLTVRVPPRPLFHWTNDMMHFQYSDIAKAAFEKVFWRGL